MKYIYIYIGKHQKTKNRFLFCYVSQESIGEKFLSRLQLNTQQKFIQTQHGLTHMSQLSQNSNTLFPGYHQN